jgi:hypothetical protein
MMATREEKMIWRILQIIGAVGIIGTLFSL